MQDTLAPEFILGTRLEARDVARELQMAGYGLHEADDIDGGYEFTFVRTGDGAVSVILMVPNNSDEEPDFIVMRHKPNLPFYERGGSDESFRTRADARHHWNWVLGGVDGYEIKPFINVLALHW